MRKKADQAALDGAIRHLTTRDVLLRQAVEAYGSPTSRRSQEGFATLARIVVDQQLSTAAAASIWAKVKSAVGNINAPNIASARGPDLKSVGLSAAKVKTLRALAAAVVAKEFTFQGLGRRSDEDVRTILTSIWGIGDWTADIYLMFAMGRPDVWPTGDLALRTGWQCVTGSKTRIETDKLARTADAWRPYRSAAAILLWHAVSSARAH
jgi:DNA-3-methyladenine glycosylase II